MGDVDYKPYGIVEGFFSRPLPPWSRKERTLALEFVKKYAPNINTYLYAPKDDPFVTDYWYLPYPARKLSEIKEFVSECKAANIRFLYGMNPALSAPRTGYKDELVGKISKKMGQLQEVGCDSFCLLFDDIPSSYDIGEGRNENLKQLAEFLVGVVDSVYEENSSIDKLWLCSPDYWFRKETGLTRALRRVNSNVSFIWTGANTFVKSITPMDTKRVRKILGSGRKIIWWDNYPVNDLEQSVGNFNLGGFNAPGPGALEGLYGVLVNPMRECGANFPFYITFSRYVGRPERYSRERSWSDALRTLLGNGAKAYADVIYEFSQRNVVDDDKKYLFRAFETTKDINKIKKRTTRFRDIVNAIKSSKAKGTCPKMFLGSIRQLFADAANILDEYEKILDGKKVSAVAFEKIDRFPTTPKSTYFEEIREVLNYRERILRGEAQGAYKRDIPPLSIENALLSNYSGSGKLRIRRKDAARLQKVIETSIDRERGLFLGYLNGDITAREKLLLLSKRRNVNRWYGRLEKQMASVV